MPLFRHTGASGILPSVARFSIVISPGAEASGSSLRWEHPQHHQRCAKPSCRPTRRLAISLRESKPIGMLGGSNEVIASFAGAAARSCSTSTWLGVEPIGLRRDGGRRHDSGVRNKIGRSISYLDLGVRRLRRRGRCGAQQLRARTKGSALPGPRRPALV